ncbi:MAG TPA: dihydrofolate reductase family protein [Streptosporangiaceae bacterium]|nr:dihydrofolate reductase family protein [Streptosporangiaceae bacterium]
MTTSGGRVVVQAAMSLDGFIAGPDHDMDWVFEFTTPDEFPDIVAATGAMLSGRRSYDVGQRDAGKPSGEAYGGAWNGPVFVLTHEPPAASPARVTFLSGDVAAAVATARSAAGDKDLVIIGADVARQCLEHGLVDEFLLMVLPVLLGDGTRLYSPGGPARIDLEPISSRLAGSVTILRYRVRGK